MSSALAWTSAWGRQIADVVCAGEQNHDFGIDSVQLAVLQAPEDILGSITAPAKVSRVPAEEILFPVGEQIGIIDGAPPSCDRVAFEVNVDPGLLRLREQLGMGDQRVGSLRKTGSSAGRSHAAG